MWIFSQNGFYSIVKKGREYHVRTRREKDLVNVGLTAIKSYSGSDYPWRAILPSRAELQRLMQKLGNTVEYPNFKAYVWNREDQRHRLGIYQKIWAIMAKEENN